MPCNFEESDMDMKFVFLLSKLERVLIDTLLVQLILEVTPFSLFGTEDELEEG